MARRRIEAPPVSGEPRPYFDNLISVTPTSADIDELNNRFLIEKIHQRRVDAQIFNLEIAGKPYRLEISFIPEGDENDLVSGEAVLKAADRNQELLSAHVYVSKERFPEFKGMLSGSDSITINPKAAKGLPRDVPAALLQKLLAFFQRAADQLGEPIVHSSYYLETLYEGDLHRDITPEERTATIDPMLARHGYTGELPDAADPAERKWKKIYHPNRTMEA